ncbi:hypothetical protein CTAYLR_007371 [Chrysophaeum taylorii]|uniref:Uncharacterized protein n=1 Tax=Chrysophaeum taylorii TaxID=2483200 RepID=A0AAD7U4F7_9STRA|nr:hypothetical protein CTAYLR_007371 [Chrysophaeum taylorii]
MQEQPASSQLASQQRREIYTYEAEWTIYALAFRQREETERKFRLALGSFMEEYTNRVSIVQRREALELNGKGDEGSAFARVGEFEHPYPATKILWSPDSTSRRDLLATTGDYLRVWNVEDGRGGESTVDMVAVLNNNKNSDYCAPLTSFDWNESEPSLKVEPTRRDLAVPAVKAQLIAHDKEVYDIAFARGKDIFASVGADGSVRLFDLRTLEHSTIVYETAGLSPILRLAWNKQDPNYIATVLADDPRTVVLDVRVPSIPVAELGAHAACVNAIAWAPHSSCHLCTCADDAQALIWDLTAMPKPIDDPILAYNADAEVNQLQWSAAHHEWIAIAYNNTMQMLHV